MKLYSVKDSEFKPYGRVIDGYDFSELISVLKDSTPCPENDTVYAASDKKLESLDAAKVLGANVYGRMPIEIGCCNGHNTKSLHYAPCHVKNEGFRIAVVLPKARMSR